MCIYSTNCDYPQQIGFIYKFDVLNGVSKFCSVYHLVYRFVQLFLEALSSVYNFVYQKNDTYCNMYQKRVHILIHIACVSNILIHILIHERMCIKTCGVSNRVSNLADRV